MISYEEYYPYGSTAYSASSSSADLSLKRYRFTGKERDEETGLDYFGVRYYASWLGRWTSGDPGGFVDGLNLYRYTRNNPVNGVDREGYSTEVVEPPPTECPDCPTSASKGDVHPSENGLNYQYDGVGWSANPVSYSWGGNGVTGQSLAPNDPLNSAQVFTNPSYPGGYNGIPNKPFSEWTSGEYREYTLYKYWEQTGKSFHDLKAYEELDISEDQNGNISIGAIPKDSETATGLMMMDVFSPSNVTMAFSFYYMPPTIIGARQVQSVAFGVKFRQGVEALKIAHRAKFAAQTGEIAYGSTDLSAMVLEYRAVSADASMGNYAVFEVETEKGFEYLMRKSIPPHQHKQYGMSGHAEKLLKGDLEARNIDFSKVTRIYSERQPCSLPGSYCDRMIKANFPSAKVTYSFEYGDKASRTAGNAAMENVIKNLGK